MSSGITTLVDIRQRRGVRGPAYRFANAVRLQELIKTIGLHYISEQRLAPTSEIREHQRRADAARGSSKRGRTELATSFVKAYETEVLDKYSIESFQALLDKAGERPAFLCVERDANACHRGVLAAWAERELGVQVTHLQPGSLEPSLASI